MIKLKNPAARWRNTVIQTPGSDHGHFMVQQGWEGSRVGSTKHEQESWEQKGSHGATQQEHGDQREEILRGCWDIWGDGRDLKNSVCDGLYKCICCPFGKTFCKDI